MSQASVSPPRRRSSDFMYYILFLAFCHSYQSLKGEDNENIEVSMDDFGSVEEEEMIHKGDIEALHLDFDEERMIERMHKRFESDRMLKPSFDYYEGLNEPQSVPDTYYDDKSEWYGKLLVGDQSFEDEPKSNVKRSVENSNISDQVYDYNQFKDEYNQDVQEKVKRNLAFNYTDKGKPEETVEEAVDKIVDFETPVNCSVEMARNFGYKSLRFCRPKSTKRKIIKYVAKNPPGVLVTKTKEKIKYKPSVYEKEVYAVLNYKVHKILERNN
uniref:(California timema) hypothetical protein n=1 Tax=Timema californicum TaxID=61474 RepID=A0A7R9J2D9_TIMCA|nr:unnamed protein product [Timema californicum]